MLVGLIIKEGIQIFDQFCPLVDLLHALLIVVRAVYILLVGLIIKDGIQIFGIIGIVLILKKTLHLHRKVLVERNFTCIIPDYEYETQNGKQNTRKENIAKLK